MLRKAIATLSHLVYLAPSPKNFFISQRSSVHGQGCRHHMKEQVTNGNVYGRHTVRLYSLFANGTGYTVHIHRCVIGPF